MELITSGPFAGLMKNGYSVIYADPAWTFTTRANTGKGRSPEQHYDCMTLDDIKALPVKDLASKNCVLLLWVIDTHLEMALDVIRAWGFTYKTKGFNWVKTNRDGSPFTGMGFWTRANPEDCLLGINFNEDCLLATTGSPKRVAKNVRRLIMTPRREHSRKPDEVRESIEQLLDGPYVELFARSSKEGWDTWGNQRSRFDVDNTQHLTEQSKTKIPPPKSLIEAAKPSSSSLMDLLGGESSRSDLSYLLT